MKNIFALLLGFLAVPACVKTAPLVDKPCPCADEQICCESSQTCVASLEMCAVFSPKDAASPDTATPLVPKDASPTDVEKVAVAVDAGGTEAQVAVAADAGRLPITPVAPTPPVPCETAAAADMFGTWSGYGENAVFDDGTDGINVTVSCRPGVGVVGTLRVGRRAEPPFASPSSADVAYPTATEVCQDDNWQTGYMRAQQLPTAGVAYSLLAVKIEGARLRFLADHNELWGEWCGLQVPGPKGTRGENPFDEREFILNWLSVCTCDALSCGADLGLSYEYRTLAFDLSFSGNRADGSALWEADHSGRASHNVHLTRQ